MVAFTAPAPAADTITSAPATLLAPELPADTSVTPAYAAFVDERLGLRLSEPQLARLDGIASDLAARGGYHGALDLLAALRAGRDEALLDELVGRLVVGETHFFRVAPQIEALRRTVLPDLIGRRAAERRLRVWSAGCSTGEEPYTLAILLRERLPADHEWRIDLVATDLNPAFVDSARAATYGEWSFRETPDWVREQYFDREGRRWRLREHVRRMVRFSVFNLTQPSLPPPWTGGTQLDLIVCRNVTIYFGPQTTHDLYVRFARALRPGGWLVTGPSDPVPDVPDLLEPVSLPGAILWRRRAAPPPGRSHPHPTPTTPLPTTLAPPLPPPPARVFARAAPTAPVIPVTPVRPTGSPRRAATASPPSPPSPPAETVTAAPHLDDGLRALEGGDTSTALESLRRATFLDPHDPLAHFALGRTYLALGQPARARAALNHARRLVAGAPDDGAIAQHPHLAAADVRRAVDSLLAALEDRR